MTPIIPKGWTYLRHGTSRSKWNFEELKNGFTVGMIDGKQSWRDMSCVDRESAANDIRQGFDTARTYGGEDGFEIRVLVYRETIFKPAGSEQEYLVDHVDENIRKRLSETYYYNRKSINYQRHPIVPSREQLKFIDITTENELTGRNDQPIFWFVPDFLEELYKQDVLLYEEEAEKKR